MVSIGIYSGEIRLVKFLEFMVVNAYGLPLFHIKNKNIQSIDKNLMASFLTTFQMTLAKSADQKLELIKFKDTNLVIEAITTPYNLFFVGRSDTKAKEKQIRKELAKLAIEFTKRYWTFLEDWTGDITLFMDFESIVAPLIQ